MKITFKRIVLGLMILCLVPVLKPKELTVYAVDNYQLLDAKTDVDLDKSWTVSLSKELDRTTVNGSNIQILDENEKPIDIQVAVDSVNSKLINIKPVSNYEQGKTYHISIKQNLKSTAGKPMTKDVVMYFTTKKIGSGTASVKKTTINLPGSPITFVEINIKSAGVDGASMVKVNNNDFLVPIGQTQRYILLDNSANIYLYTQDGDYVGSGELNISSSNDNVTFDIDRSGGI